ncbi:MAG: hypothetical protein JXO44_14040 [Clostridia bacterium]|nr:hypothetical protein [Clostridia bacterium]
MILEYVPFLVLGLCSAYYAHKLDVKYDYVSRLNKKLKLKSYFAIVFYIGLMSLLMFLVPYVSIVKLGMSKYISYLLVSVTCGFCCYSATDYKQLTNQVR